jgi:hypothetical protein
MSRTVHPVDDANPPYEQRLSPELAPSPYLPGESLDVTTRLGQGLPARLGLQAQLPQSLPSGGRGSEAA